MGPAKTGSGRDMMRKRERSTKIKVTTTHIAERISASDEEIRENIRVPSYKPVLTNGSKNVCIRLATYRVRGILSREYSIQYDIKEKNILT